MWWLEEVNLSSQVIGPFCHVTLKFELSSLVSNSLQNFLGREEKRSYCGAISAKWLCFVQISLNITMASSSETPHHSYDVFLSFRGEDVRDNFLEHLDRALYQKGISTFKDDDGLREGESIRNELLDAIEESRFSIIVISLNYADSSWCLDELVHILHCKKRKNHVVYPVFYHVDPSQVRNIIGEFGKGFVKAASKNKGKVQKWREALNEVANLKGRAYPSSKYKTEVNLIDEIVHTILSKPIETYRCSDDGLVGIGSRKEEVMKLLDLGSNETRAVGLWGMGGIGKTTLAREVYNAISGQFEGCSFIDNVREVIGGSGGISRLQEQLISEILREKDSMVRSYTDKRNTIQKRVCNKRVLIVLDDVSEPKQAEKLVGHLHWFRHGSRIIITTRDKKVLDGWDVRDQYVFNVPELNEDEARQLFKSKAFLENAETGEFRRFISRAVEYAKGVPLALEVLGSSLKGEKESVWESALARLKDSPGKEVEQVLRISYDGLDPKDKDIFLDIACFFQGLDRDAVIYILDSCGFNSECGVNFLVKKSLLTISVDNKLVLHDLVKMMGRSIVADESPKEPGKRSRIWQTNDVKRVLLENTGTEKVEGISLLSHEKVELRHDAFAKMSNLRILGIRGTCCSVDLPNKLCLLDWDEYPLRCLPSTFQPERLVELYLTNSRIERLWDRTMELPKLQLMDLTNSTSLKNCPDLKVFPNLEYLSLRSCTALVDLHPSIKHLKKLVWLDLEGCRSLKTLPNGIECQAIQFLRFSGCSKLTKILECFGDLQQLTDLYLDETSITELAESIGKSINLDCLDLSYCGKLKSLPSSIGQLNKLKQLWLYKCSSLRELPEGVGLLDGLNVLNVSYSGVRRLPASVLSLRNLQILQCRGCITSGSLSFLGSEFSGYEFLTELDLIDCHLKSIPESISSFSSLKRLYLVGNGFESLPASIKNLSNLKGLYLNSCKNLRELPDLPSNIEEVFAGNCDFLETVCSLTVFRHARTLLFEGCPKLLGNKEIRILMNYKYLYNRIKLTKSRCDLAYSSPGSQIPQWITYQNDGGGSVKLHRPIQDLKAPNLLGFAFSVVVVAAKGQECSICVHIGTGGIFFSFGGFYRFSSENKNLMNIFYPINFFNFHEFDMGATDLEVRFVTVEPEPYFRFHKTDKALEPAPEVKACGVCPIYEKEVGSSNNSRKIDELPTDESKVRHGKRVKRVSTRLDGYQL